MVAQGKNSVLLLGETGVGKEVLARAIHDRSDRRHGPFIGLNCAALSEALLESELFGHEAGAFTGAAKAKPGLLEMADGGTVFLDELRAYDWPGNIRELRNVIERAVILCGGGVCDERFGSDVILHGRCAADVPSP